MAATRKGLELKIRPTNGFLSGLIPLLSTVNGGALTSVPITRSSDTAAGGMYTQLQCSKLLCERISYEAGFEACVSTSLPCVLQISILRQTYAL